MCVHGYVCTNIGVPLINCAATGGRSRPTAEREGGPPRTAWEGGCLARELHASCVLGKGVGRGVGRGVIMVMYVTTYPQGANARSRRNTHMEASPELHRDAVVEQVQQVEEVGGGRG